MKRFFKYVVGWVAAVFTTVILGVGLQTQNVISRLGGIGADVGIAERVAMTFYDLRYLGSLYFIFVGLAFIVAFLAGSLVFKRAKFGCPVIYTAAGAIGILVMLFTMKEAFFDVHLIAGARSGFGITLQMLAGAIGGYVFSQVSEKPKEKGLRE